ncbi:MAG TPA: hypothetical protein VGN72_05770 [Tepidisphaeraceae bacterium]|jgi:hypothetical protein|nr:hypothetical protein [Tepidisphaeraceae bacterium]
MKLNAKTGAYASILTVGAVWLAVDLLSSPAEADASSDPANDATATALVLPSRPPAGSPGATLRDRLEEAFANTVRDADLDPFHLPAIQQQAPVDPAAADHVDSPYRWQLTAIVRLGADQGIVLVDGHRVRVGQSFRGYRLQGLDGKRAVFINDSDGVSISLKLRSD